MKLIIDSGSTKSDWVLISKNSTPKEFKTKGINPLTQENEEVKAIITAQKELLSLADLVSEVFFYGAGCAQGEAKETMESILKSIFSNAIILVDTDLMASVLAVSQGKPSIACILGTGSNACYFDGKKIIQNVPALGYVMGDDGAGTYFGKQLLRAYFYKKMPKELMLPFEKTYSLTIQNVLIKVYKEQSPNRYLASFTEFIGANKTHPFMQKIIKNGFDYFIENSVCCYRIAKQVDVNFVGSVAYYFEKELRASAAERGINVGKVLQKPIKGLIEYYQAK